MTPSQAAFQLSHVWRAACPNEDIFPVNATQIAEMLNIKVLGDDELGDDFEAALFIRPKGKRIIYNGKIREEGRKNFSIAHEIGHSSLHAGREEFRCSIRDLTDMDPHPQNIEQEANKFASTLLMPADDFREQMGSQDKTLANLSELANNRYHTSVTATCIRYLEMSQQSPLAMIRTRGNRVLGWSRTDNMKYSGFWLHKNQEPPPHILTHDPFGAIVDSHCWLKKKHADKWELFQSAIMMPFYDQTLILLRATQKQSQLDSESLGELDPTPPSIPKWR